VSTSWDIQRVARAALIVAAVFAGVWMLWRFLPALAWAGVLAIATWPLRRELAQRRMGNTAVATVLTLILALVLVLPLIELGIQAAHEARTIVGWVREIRQNGLSTPHWLSNLPYVGSAVGAWWQTNLAEPGAARALLAGAETTGIFTLTRALGIEVASRLTILVFSLLALFFLYRDGPNVMAEARVIAERLFGPPGSHLAQNVVSAVRATVNGLVLVGLAEGVLLGIAYAVAGLPHAALLGLATAVLAIVPFGAPLVFVLCSLALLAQSQTTAALALLVFGLAVVFVADHFVCRCSSGVLPACRSFGFYSVFSVGSKHSA
jgi:predicted PurR-regulated permease PerM